MQPERFQIFISSPGDVAEERVLANNLVRRLGNEFANRLWIEPVFWEHEPLLATDTFQRQIPPPRECAVAICILWSRIGTRLPENITRQADTPFGPKGSRYASGTEYEFEDAATSFHAHGAPQLLVYRKTATPVVDLSDRADVLRRLEQKEALEQFVQKWFFNQQDGTIKAASHTFATASEFVEILEEHLRKLIVRRLEQIPAQPSDAAPARISWTSGSPFRGLQVFDFEHAPVFFGRTQAIGEVIDALRKNAAAGKAFVLVLGNSGGGKSSLVRAGVLPVLTQHGVIENISFCRRAVFKPSDGGGSLMHTLATALLAVDGLPELGADGTDAEKLAKLLGENPASAFLLIKGGLSQAAAKLAGEKKETGQPEGRLVLVLDQLEEMFTLARITAAQRQAFAGVLSSLARGGNVLVIATLRGDFYHRLFELPELGALKEGAGQYDLAPPSGAEIGQMIRQPARAAGLGFEEDPQTRVPLDEVLREAASRSPESLPLLEFALDELYQRKSPQGLLTYEAYKDLRGVEGALAKRAEEVFGALTAEVKDTLPRVMRALVSVREGEAMVRQQALLDAVCSTPQSRALVEAFISARLFSADRTEEGPAVRVAHEALLRNWPRVKEWLEQDRELLIVRGRVIGSAARWHKEGRPADLLLPDGKPLDEAQNLAVKLGDDLPGEARGFIAASHARRQRRNLLKRTAIAALVLLAAAIAVASMQASRERNRAAANQRLAEANGALAKRRLQTVSQLTQLLDGVNDSLADLPGSTPARTHLAEIALQSLNSFETDEHSDSVFLLALAKANSKVAALLGNPYSANAGQVRQAMDSYQRSRTILERLTAADASNGEAQRSLAECYMGIGVVQEQIGEQRGAQESERKGLEVWTKVAAAAPSDRIAVHRKLRAYIYVGDTQFAQGYFDQALVSYKQAQALHDELAVPVRGSSPEERVAEEKLSLLDLYNCLERLGEAQSMLGLNSQAMENFQRTAQIAQSLLDQPASTPYMRLAMVVSYRNIGEMHLVMNDLPAAMENFAQGMSHAKSLFNADPNNSWWGRNVWATCQKIGDIRLRMGDAKGALDYSRQALEITSHVPSDSVATFTLYQLSASYQVMGEASAQLASGDQAILNCRKGLEYARKWVAADPDSALARMNLALAHVRAAHAIVQLAQSDDPSMPDKGQAWSQAVEELSAADSIVKGAKSDHTFMATWDIWFSSMPADLDAARQKRDKAPPTTRPVSPGIGA